MRPSQESCWTTWGTVSSGFARSRSAEVGWSLWGFLPHFLPRRSALMLRPDELDQTPEERDRFVLRKSTGVQRGAKLWAYASPSGRRYARTERTVPAPFHFQFISHTRPS